MQPQIRAPIGDARLTEWNRNIERAIGAVRSSTSGLSGGWREITASSGVSPDDFLILVDATAGAVTITLPAAADSRGRYLVVKKVDAGANAMTLDGYGAETIDGAATRATTTQYVALTVFCDGTEWWII